MDDNERRDTDVPDESQDQTSSQPELRIDAPEAGVVAGLSSPKPVAPPSVDEPEATQVYELPDWADPPTGQVPRILLDDPDAIEHSEPIVRGPSWRQDAQDWNEDIDLSVLAPDVDETSVIAGVGGPPTEAPFAFAFDEAKEDEDLPWQGLLQSASGSAADRRRRHSRRPASRRSPARTAPATSRNALLAVATGVGLLAVAIACFLGGAPSTLGLATIVIVIGAGEAFATLQRVGYRPATLVGLAGVAALVLGAYLHGPQAIAVVFGITAVMSAIWFVLMPKRSEPLVDLSVTLFVVAWVGVLGSFATLLLTPRNFPHRHGVALVVAAILLTAAYDIGAYAIGAWLGKHRIAPHISPNKSLEGLIGGTIACLAVGAIGIAHLHPFDLAKAVGLAAVVAVFAPLGDLVESMIKRDLDIKDMGSVLPGHGGVLDRIDAMLFVMAPAYVFVELVHF